MSKYQPYPEYKDSGIEWLGHIPEKWMTSKIKYEASIFGRIGFRGYTTSDIVDKGEGAISLSPSNIINNKMVYNKSTYLSWDKYDESPEIKINQDDVVLVKTASIGKIGYIDTLPEKMTLNPQLIVFKKLKCHSKYLYYMLNTKLIKAYMDNSNTGSTVPTMSQESILNFVIPSCSYSEQTTIANFLDRETAKIDTLIEKQQELIELLNEKRKAVISHAVTKGLNPNVKMKDSGVEWLGDVPDGWEVTRAKFVSKIFIPQRNKPELNDTTGTYWLTMDNMKTSHITSTKYYVSDSESKQAGSKVLISGSVIASRVGNFGIVAINKVDVIINQQLQAYMPFNIDNNYLRLLISSSKSYFEIVGTATTLIFVNREGFENLPVCLPPINEQTKIASYIDIYTTKLDTLIEKSNQAITLLKERRTALISAAVTGKIDARKEN